MEAKIPIIARPMSNEESINAHPGLPEELRDLRAQLAAARADLARYSAREQAGACGTATSLDESQERLRLAIKAARMGIWDWDIVNDRVTFSDELLRLRGLPPGEPPRNFEYVVSAIDPSQQSEFREAIRRSLAEGTEFAIELRVFRLDGTFFWSSSRAVIHYDPPGRPVRMVGVSMDITERKETERALRESERRMRLILDTAMEAVITLDSAGIITSWNQQAERIFGWPAQEALGQRLSDTIIPPEHRDGHERGLRHFLATGESNLMRRRLEMTALRRTGERFPVELSITPVCAEGHPPAFCGFLRDITDRKQAEEELKRANSLLRATVESTADGILVVDTAGRITLFNRRFVEMWRIPDSILATRDDHQALQFVLDQLREPDRFLAKVQELYAQPDAASYDLLEFKDARVVERFSQPQKIAGENVGRVWSFRDITERQRAEAEIRRLNATLEGRVQERTSQLEIANQELEAFSYSVSHDLRAPLRHIIGFAALLRGPNEQPLSASQTRQLDIIVEAAKRMGVLIEDLLAFSRTGRQELRRTRIALGLILEEARRELREEEAGRKVTWQISPLPDVECDPALLRVVLVNLLGNALKYSTPRDEARIEVGCTAGELEWTFFVRDNGVGFDMNYAPKLFGVFQRLHRDEEFPGTGIGLATVRRIIHRHGGRTWAEGKPGEGATFYFTLPKS